MITFRVAAEVKNDRRVVLTLPAEVPTGQGELVITVESPVLENAQPGSGLAAWVEAQTGANGSQQSRYPLRGSVVRYERPTEPLAEGEWAALR